MIKVCFVCLGNICRSPTAEGVMRYLVDKAGLTERIEIDSAGTAAYHAGEPADGRSRQTARERGMSLDSIARQFRKADFERFDYVVAMDSDNRRNLERLAPSDEARAKISMLRAYDPDSEPDDDVPDPYYGGADGFERVFDICEAGCAGLLAHLVKEHGLD